LLLLSLTLLVSLVKREGNIATKMAALLPLKVHVVVIEVGSVLLRIGIAGEAHPRFIIPIQQFFSSTSSSDWAVYQALQGRMTPDTASSSSSSQRVPTAADFRRKLVVLFNRIFLDYLHVSSKECKVIIIEKLHTPTAIRDGLMTALLKDLQVIICCSVAPFSRNRR
jgi:hypothetical protein